MRKVWLIGSMALVATGCAGVKVTDGAHNALPGIPFYVKSPQLVQETKWLGDQIGVRFQLSTKVGSEVSTHDLPATGPLLLPPSPQAEAALQKAELAFQAIPDSTDLDAASTRVAAILNALREATGNPAPTVLLSNVRKHEMVAGPEVHYLKSRIPFMGSASTQFEFAPDGTLTKMQADTTEETVSTVLSMIPVTAWATNQWNLTPPDTGTEALALDSRSILRDARGLALGRQATKVLMQVVRTPMVYTIRKAEAVHQISTVRSPTGDRRVLVPSLTPTTLAPLTMADALSGNNGVQLVSALPAAAPPKDEAQGYRFSGEVVPPKSK